MGFLIGCFLIGMVIGIVRLFRGAKKGMGLESYFDVILIMLAGYSDTIANKMKAKYADKEEQWNDYFSKK
jgi:hypothetical protein